MKKEDGYAVIVSDLKMPGMDGVEFFVQGADVAKDSVRIMLTGHGDLEAAVLAVNRGQIICFLNKSTSMDEMERVLEVSAKQHELITVERELLRGTFRGAIKLLTDILLNQDIMNIEGSILLMSKGQE